MNLGPLIEMSRRYGSDENYVLAGGGNTSYKENGVMYVKGSGSSLATISPEQFVAMDVAALVDIMRQQYPAAMSDDEREEVALHRMMASKLPGEESKRPSVEAILHAMFPQSYVLHVHPPLVNGLTCGKQGAAKCAELFGGEAVWIELTKPGLILSQKCDTEFCSYSQKSGKYPQIVILENHGIFVAADCVEEVDKLMSGVMSTLEAAVIEKPCFDEVPFDRSLACSAAPALRMLYSGDGMAVAVFTANKQVMDFVKDSDSFAQLIKPFSPDHIVYCKDEPLFIGAGADITAEFNRYVERKGFKPKIAAIAGLGFFALGDTMKEAIGAQTLFLDAVKVAVYAKSFGGANPLPDEFTDFILNWEVEKYRSKVSNAAGTGAGSRLAGRIAIVTGGAQGFGKGIAEAMAAEGAYLAIADLNLEGAAKCAAELNASHGSHRAIAVAADVSDEAAV